MLPSSAVEMNVLYKVQYREAGEVQFRDDNEWFSCDDCIARMRSLFDEHSQRDFRIVDEHGIVVASTLKKSPQASPRPRSAGN